VTKKYIYILFLLINSITCFAQDSNALFVEANKLYQQENYPQAIEKYIAIEKQEVVSAELYYNLANAYYRTNKVASSIYYYEKALQLKPNSKDIKVNLGFAKRMTIDNIEKLPTTIMQKFSRNFIQKLDYNSWAYITILFVFLFAFLFLTYHFSYSTNKKRGLFVLSNLSILFFIISLFFAFHTYKVANSKQEAIIFAQETNIKNAPILSSETIFELHEGTKITILENKDNWTKIKIADGQTGWIITKELKEL
jgi:tetratricopeptide (TPR) repeat protein